jgi:NADH dehydrogenase
MQQDIITIIGGTGFLGRYVVRQLAKAGYTVRVISRNPNAPDAQALKTSGDVGQIVLTGGNLADPQSLTGKIEGSHAVINLVGILYESGSQRFARLHAQGAEKLAQMAKNAGVKRFIHVSSLGVDKAHGSSYANSKMLGEKAVMAACPNATILRPSVVFGAEDNFFNQFAGMASLLPALPLIGGGGTKFQPVYAGDVAQAVEACLANDATAGRIFELGGPKTYTFRELLTYIMQTIHKERALVNVPFSVASALGTVLQHLPNPKLTRDQVQLLRYDNVVSPDALKLEDLGITPTAIETIVPTYLARFAPYKEAA